MEIALDATLTEKRVEDTFTDHGQVIALDRFAVTASPTLAITPLVPRDGLGRRTQVSHSHGTNTLANYDYTYDAISRVQTIDSLAGLTTLRVDDNGRLKSPSTSFLRTSHSRTIPPATGSTPTTSSARTTVYFPTARSTATYASVLNLLRNTGITNDGFEVVDEATSPFTLDSLPRPLHQLLFPRS